MGRQEQWEAFQDMRGKYQEACDELTKALADLDEARALPKMVYVVTKNGETIIGVFENKDDAVKELESWVVTDWDSFGVKEFRVR